MTDLNCKVDKSLFHKKFLVCFWFINIEICFEQLFANIIGFQRLCESLFMCFQSILMLIDLMLVLFFSLFNINILEIQVIDLLRVFKFFQVIKFDLWIAFYEIIVLLALFLFFRIMVWVFWIKSHRPQQFLRSSIDWWTSR